MRAQEGISDHHADIIIRHKADETRDGDEKEEDHRTNLGTQGLFEGGADGRGEVGFHERIIVGDNVSSRDEECKDSTGRIKLGERTRLYPESHLAYVTRFPICCATNAMGTARAAFSTSSDKLQIQCGLP